MGRRAARCAEGDRVNQPSEAPRDAEREDEQMDRDLLFQRWLDEHCFDDTDLNDSDDWEWEP